jgi:WS/DGAT/MGAT family acyltransferase
MPPKVEPLTNVDAAWLGMEDPTNLMMVSGILTFDEPIDMDHLRAVLNYRFLKFERFRQCVVQPKLPLASPYWETDPNFTLDSHLHRVALPAPGDQAALQAMVSDLMSTPLDFTKPLWQMHLIENFGEGCALMVRLHHCIADGIALTSVLLALTDFSADSPWPTADDSDDSGEEERLFGGALGSGALNALVKQARLAAKSARKLTGKVIHEGLEAIIAPAKAVDLAIQGTDNALAFSRLVLRTPDPKTIFKGKLGVAKRATWSRPLPLKQVKTIKNVTGGTVNDVLVSALAGALRRYLIGRNQPVDGLTFRAFIPVNIRSNEEMTQLGNKFSLVFLPLPVGLADPLDRLNFVREHMDNLKKSPEIPVAFSILKGIGMSPAELQEVMVTMFGSKATAVLTNVPGPPIPLYFAGRKISGLMFWVPQSGRVSLGLSILSYAGQVSLGVATDAGLVPDPQTIIDGFYAEYETLLELVQQAEEIETEEKLVAQVEDDPNRCQAMTKNGRRCRNRSMDGSDFCRVHRPT